MKEMYREPEMELVLNLCDVIRTSDEFNPDYRGEDGDDEAMGPGTNA